MQAPDEEQAVRRCAEIKLRPADMRAEAEKRHAQVDEQGGDGAQHRNKT